MKDFKYTLLIAIVAFLIGARPDRFGTTELFRAANRLPALGSHKPQTLAPAQSSAAPAPSSAQQEIARAADELSTGSVEEYAAEPGGANQGGGYGDVFDSDGHLIWRFAVFGHDNSHWTILRYFAEGTAKRTNLEAAGTPQVGN
jgi:hypothetical protein